MTGTALAIPNDLDGATLMPTAVLYRHDLSPPEVCRTTDKGDVWGLNLKIQVDGYTRLLPVADLAKIKAELTQALEPMGPEVAAKQVKVLLGSFPSARPENPDVYVRAMTAMLADAPMDIGREAVRHVVETWAYGAPPPAAISDAIDEPVRLRRWALRMAKAQADEHQRRQRLKQREQDLERDRQDRRDNADAYDRWIWLGRTGNRHRVHCTTWAEFKALWADTPEADRATLGQPPEPAEDSAA